VFLHFLYSSLHRMDKLQNKTTFSILEAIWSHSQISGLACLFSFQFFLVSVIVISYSSAIVSDLRLFITICFCLFFLHNSTFDLSRLCPIWNTFTWFTFCARLNGLLSWELTCYFFSANYFSYHIICEGVTCAVLI